VTLFLFDIDGTLVKTDGAGREAMALAARELYGRDLFDGFSFAGGVDWGMTHEALERAGIRPTRRQITSFRMRYLSHLRRTMTPGKGTTMPGIATALPALAARGRLGLLTGNWRQGAEVKLRAHGLWDHFYPRASAFGGDAPRRDDLLAVAWKRARRLGELRHIVVIGDTPADVRCARATLPDSGVRVTAVAVRTGFATEEELVRAQPDLLIADLEHGLPALLARL
jgi:phosphoglycolate phosphatase-like HAD superfamily hydrolase